MEDMHFIDTKEISYPDKLNLVSDSFKLAMSIDINSLFENATLFAIKKPDEIQVLNPEISSLWKSRQIKLVE